MTAISGKKYDLVVFAAILAIITLQLIKLGDYPGLYLDAINPDYIAVQMLHPQDMRLQYGFMFSRPWLGQPYHGANGIIITLLSVLVTGSTSVLQHHITYGIVASIAVFLTYLILTHKAVGISKLWAGLGSIILISWPSLLAIIITQSYMCLFGSVCILGGVLLFLDWLDDIKAQGRLSLCYLLFGLAFYSYFNFMFFLPPLMICTAFAFRKYGSISLDDIATPLLAYILGCGIYIVGWSQVALGMNGVDMAVTGNKVKLFFAVYILLAITFIAFFKRIKGRKLLLCYLIAGGILWLIKIMPAFREMNAQYAIIQNTTLTEKIAAVFRDYSSILTSSIAGNPGARSKLFESVTVLNSQVPMCFVIAVLTVFAVELYRRNFIVKWKLPVAVIAFYLCCCVVFGTRMMQHHYATLLFITYLGFALCTQRFFECIGKSGTPSCVKIAWGKTIILKILVLCIIILNLFNQQKIINEIHDTGGDGFFSSELTDLAHEATRRKDNGIHEFYVFMEPAFHQSFDYLTMNRIPYVRNGKPASNKLLITKYYKKGNDIVVLYWNKKATSVYANILKDISGGTGGLTYKDWTDKNGRKEFYEIRLSHTKNGNVSSQKK